MSNPIASITAGQQELISNLLLNTGHKIDFKDGELHISHGFYKAVGRRVIKTIEEFALYSAEFATKIKTTEARLY